MRRVQSLLVPFTLGLTLLAVVGCAAPAPAPAPTLPPPTLAQFQPTATLPSVGGAPPQAPTGTATTAATAAATRAATSAAPTGVTPTITVAPAPSGTTNPASATVAAATETVEPTEEPAHPSNPGGPGPAVGLSGNVTSGAQIFVTSCAVCHGPEGKKGIANPGSADGTVPPLNPIDDTMKSTDAKTFATNIDLFLEHGSTPEGAKPSLTMPAWGDQKLLTPQQIADVIAYIMSLNK